MGYKGRKYRKKQDMRLQLIINYYNGMNETGRSGLLEQAEFLFGKHKVEKREGKIKMA